MLSICVGCVAPNDRDDREWQHVKDMNENCCFVSLYRNIILSDKISPVTLGQYDLIGQASACNAKRICWKQRVSPHRKKIFSSFIKYGE
jgi:hypothetical protein